MTKSKALTLSPRVMQARPARSDGFPLSLLKLPAEVSRGREAFAFGIDISAAPVPPRRYAAELADVRLANGDVRFLFGQRYLDEDALESAISVRMNPIATKQLLASIEDMQNPGLSVIAERMGVAPAPLQERFTRPSHMANMVANLAAIAVSGYEVCIDFYHASAFAYRQVAKESDQLEVEPIVRVDLQTGLFVSIVDRMRTLAADLPMPPHEGEVHGRDG